MGAFRISLQQKLPALNPHMTPKTDFPVVINDQTYNLRFGMKAFRTVEDTNYRCNACRRDQSHTFMQTFQECGKGSLSALALLIFAGLRINHPEMTLALVDDLIDACDDIMELTVSVIKAVENYYSTKTKKSMEDDAKKKESISSTPMDASTLES